MPRETRIILPSVCMLVFCTFFLMSSAGNYGAVTSIEDQILNGRGNADKKMELYRKLYNQQGEHNYNCLRAVIHQMQKEFRNSKEYPKEYGFYMGDFGSDFPDSFFRKGRSFSKHWKMYFLKWSCRQGDSKTIKYLQELIELPGISNDKKALAAYALVGAQIGGKSIRSYVESNLQFKTREDSAPGDVDAACISSMAVSEYKNRMAITYLMKALSSTPPGDWLSLNEDAFSALCEFDDPVLRDNLKSFIKKDMPTAKFLEARLVYGYDTARVKELFALMGNGGKEPDINLWLFVDFLAEKGNKRDMDMILDRLPILIGKERFLAACAIMRIIGN